MMEEIHMSNANDFEIQGHLLKKYNGVEKKVLIPENVWEIASNAFCKNNDVRKLQVQVGHLLVEML